MRSSKRDVGFALGASITAALVAPNIAHAQAMEEIVVTSRKVTEKLLDAPITVSAFSSEAIEARGITDLRSVAAFTPGLTLSTQTGNSKAERTIQSINMRGMNKGGLVTVFIDGVATQGLIEGIDDVDRVEILKGPQSALFGRSTFAGAINIITKDPAQHFGGRIDASIGSNVLTDDRITLEGPLLADKLSARVSARYYSVQGQYANTAIPGTRLNDQSSRGVNAKVLVTPTDDMRISIFAKYSKDDDGPGALGKFARQDYNCNAGAAPAGQVNYICGTLPAFPSSRLGETTIFTPAVRNVLFNNATNLWNPLFPDHLGLNHGGVVNIVKFGEINAEYTFPNSGFTFSSLTGVENQAVSEYGTYQNVATNLDPIYANPNYVSATATPNVQPWRAYDGLVDGLNKRWSQEFRLTSDTKRRLRGFLGGNYNFTRSQTASANLQATGGQLNLPGAAAYTRTTGIFGSITYDVLPETLTANFEGRYQVDRIQNKNRVANGGPDALTPFLSGATKTFLYRGIVQYHVTPNVQLYATTAKAVNPGAFNNFSIYSAAQQAVIASLFSVGPVIKPEYLYNYELGTKGSFLDGRLTVSVAGYHSRWTNQQVGQSLPVPTVTAAGVPTGGTQLVIATTNVAHTTLNGVELEGQARLTPEISLSYAASISDSKVYGFICSNCVAISGIPVINGKEMPAVAKYFLSVGPGYQGLLSGDMDWYARASYTYHSGQYDSYANLAKTKASHNVDIRLGLTTKVWNLEAFVTNALNNRAPIGLEQNVDILSAGFSDRVINVTMPTLRRFGVRAKYNF